jgi:galactonate dehydratase
LADLAQACHFYAHGGHDVVLPDLRSTGVRIGMSMLELASASGVEASLHNPAGPILDAISAQVAAALPAFLILEGPVGEGGLFDLIAGENRRLDRGSRVLGDGPGIGFDPDPQVLQQFANRKPAKVDSFVGISGAEADG